MPGLVPDQLLSIRHEEVKTASTIVPENILGAINGYGVNARVISALVVAV